jgi:hypothetical protein
VIRFPALRKAGRHAPVTSTDHGSPITMKIIAIEEHFTIPMHRNAERILKI